mgnify:CR=1 FL=1
MWDKFYTKGLKYCVFHDSMRYFAESVANKVAYYTFMRDKKLSAKVREERYLVFKCLIKIVDKILSNKNFPKESKLNLMNSLVFNLIMGGKDQRSEFVQKHSFEPPLFLTISPTKRCNLHCEGCYANSTSKDSDTLEYSILTRIIKEKNQLWGSYFTVISGGEPFLYKSESKTILDLFLENPQDFFLMYTNGIMINDEVAEKLAQAGNVTPAISVEGFEEETDNRRGKGAFKKIMQAMDRLEKNGVMYGISVTATKHNANLMLSEEFNKFYFEEKHAMYAWIFHYMPIGRSINIKTMVTPEQRMQLFYKMQKVMRERELFVVDFWNSSPISDGCISAGRSWGYFYINWKGDVLPCVFNPYFTHNIKDIYNNGGTLNDALLSPFFARIRDWQAKYGYSAEPERKDNQLTPCPIRDHYAIMWQWIKEYQAKPADEDAKIAIIDELYKENLSKYGEEVYKITKKIWEKLYLNK